MKTHWKKYLLYASLIIVGGCLIFILVETVRAKNTGFEAKTLWDWMELLIIPLVLAGGVFFLNRSEKEIERKSVEDRAKLEREIATDRQQEVALQSYLDRMADLLFKEDLATLTNKERRKVARIRTLTVLRGLDVKRKGFVLLFLCEAGLIDSFKDTVIDLAGADFSDADLSDADIIHANLRGANFSGANLRRTIFDGADLSNALLINANLRGTDLEGRIGPGLPTRLYGADLSFADLTGAHITKEQLETVKSLKGATMPDGTKNE